MKILHRVFSDCLARLKASAKGKRFIHEPIKTILADSLLPVNDHQGSPATWSLSSRELEVLVLVSEGLTNHQVADKLSISHRTVDTHKNNMLKRTKANNMVHLVKMALKQQVID